MSADDFTGLIRSPESHLPSDSNTIDGVPSGATRCVADPCIAIFQSLIASTNASLNSVRSCEGVYPLIVGNGSVKSSSAAPLHTIRGSPIMSRGWIATI